MKIKLICLLMVLMLAMVGTASAETVTIDFEDFDNYDLVGTYYPGLTFSGEQILQKPDYNWEQFPPHSGINVIFDLSPKIRIDFDDCVTRASIWTTTNSISYLEAYDSSDALIDSDQLTENMGGHGQMEVSGSNIAYVILHDSGNTVTYDDLEYDTECTEIPEFPTIALPVVAVLGLAFFFQRRND